MQEALDNLFSKSNKLVTENIDKWLDKVYDWRDEYYNLCPDAYLSVIPANSAIFVFDHTYERVILTYALSAEQVKRRDYGSMRAFPNVNATVRKVLGENAFLADKGHFLSHSSGGRLDINLFPQERRLNRGWSDEGKIYRRMERHVERNLGTFFYSYPNYIDDTWLPYTLNYGVFMEDDTCWEQTFLNRGETTNI